MFLWSEEGEKMVVVDGKQARKDLSRLIEDFPNVSKDAEYSKTGHIENVRAFVKMSMADLTCIVCGGSLDGRPSREDDDSSEYRCCGVKYTIHPLTISTERRFR